MKYIITSLLLTFVSALNAQVCQTCYGEQVVYYQEKVLKSTNTTYSYLGELTKTYTTKQYGNQTQSMICGACRGTGRVLPRPPAPPKSTYRRKTNKKGYDIGHYIMKNYNKRSNPKDNKLIPIKDVPGGNFYAVRYKSSNKTETDIVAATSKTSYKGIGHKIKYYSIHQDKDDNFIALKVKKRSGGCDFYDANGNEIASYKNDAVGLDGEYIWVENPDARPKNELSLNLYELQKFPSGKTALEGAFPFEGTCKCLNLFEAHGLIDVPMYVNSEKFYRGIINKNKEIIVPFEYQNIVRCDPNEPYIYVADEYNRIFMFDHSGNYLTAKPELKVRSDCGENFKCIESDNKMVAKDSENTLWENRKLTQIESTLPHLDGAILQEFSAFDSEGWADIQFATSPLKNRLHKSGFVAAVLPDHLEKKRGKYVNVAPKGLYQLKDLPKGSVYEYETGLTLNKKGNKVGGSYWSGENDKAYKIKTKYKDVRYIAYELIAVQDFDGKWGVIIPMGKDYGNFVIKPQFDFVIGDKASKAYGSKDGVLYRIIIDHDTKKHEIVKAKDQDMFIPAYSRKMFNIESLGINDKAMLTAIKKTDKLDPLQIERVEPSTGGYELIMKDGGSFFFSKEFGEILFLALPEGYQKFGYPLSLKDEREVLVPIQANNGKWYVFDPYSESITQPEHYVFDEILYKHDGKRYTPYFKNQSGVFYLTRDYIQRSNSYREKELVAYKVD